MKMEYKVLNNGTAVILTRQPELVYDELYITFTGAPPDATATFETSKGATYRKVEGTECSIPVKLLEGEVKVSLVVLDGSARPKRWLCEEIKAVVQKNGGTLISPNDMNLPQTVVELRLEVEELRKGYENLFALYQSLEKRLEDIMEGYNIT